MDPIILTRQVYLTPSSQDAVWKHVELCRKVHNRLVGFIDRNNQFLGGLHFDQNMRDRIFGSTKLHDVPKRIVRAVVADIRRELSFYRTHGDETRLPKVTGKKEGYKAPLSTHDFRLTLKRDRVYIFTNDCCRMDSPLPVNAKAPTGGKFQIFSSEWLMDFHYPLSFDYSGTPITARNPRPEKQRK